MHGLAIEYSGEYVLSFHGVPGGFLKPLFQRLRSCVSTRAQVRTPSAGGEPEGSVHLQLHLRCRQIPGFPGLTGQPLEPVSGLQVQ